MTRDVLARPRNVRDAMIIRHARQFSPISCSKPAAMFATSRFAVRPPNRLWLFVPCGTSKSSKLHQDSIFLQVKEAWAESHLTLEILQLLHICGRWATYLGVDFESREWPPKWRLSWLWRRGLSGISDYKMARDIGSRTNNFSFSSVKRLFVDKA